MRAELTWSPRRVSDAGNQSLQCFLHLGPWKRQPLRPPLLAEASQFGTFIKDVKQGGVGGDRSMRCPEWHDRHQTCTVHLSPLLLAPLPDPGQSSTLHPLLHLPLRFRCTQDSTLASSLLPSLTLPCDLLQIHVCRALIHDFPTYIFLL